MGVGGIAVASLLLCIVFFIIAEIKERFFKKKPSFEGIFFMLQLFWVFFSKSIKW